MNPPPQELRPLVHQKVDALTDQELAEVHRQLLLLELRREMDSIGDNLSNEWLHGRVTQDKVDLAVKTYRLQQAPEAETN